MRGALTPPTPPPGRAIKRNRTSVASVTNVVPGQEGREDPGAPAEEKTSALGAPLPAPAAHAPHTHTPLPGGAEQPIPATSKEGLQPDPHPQFRHSRAALSPCRPRTSVLVQGQAAAPSCAEHKGLPLPPGPSQPHRQQVEQGKGWELSQVCSWEAGKRVALSPGSWWPSERLGQGQIQLTGVSWAGPSFLILGSVYTSPCSEPVLSAAREHSAAGLQAPSSRPRF